MLFVHIATDEILSENISNKKEGMTPYGPLI